MSSVVLCKIGVRALQEAASCENQRPTGRSDHSSAVRARSRLFCSAESEERVGRAPIGAFASALYFHDGTTEHTEPQTQHTDPSVSK